MASLPLSPMTSAARVSYAFIAAVFVLAAATHLATPLVAVLFSYFALRKLRVSRRRWLSLAVFLVLVVVILFGIGLLITQAIVALPNIAIESLPPLIAYAQKHGFELPFSDFDSLKTTIVDIAKSEFLIVGGVGVARAVTRQLVFVLVAVVIAISLFLRSEHERPGTAETPNLFTALASEVKIRFSVFYESFERVMGAQITISTINTVLTAIFVAVIGLKYFPLVVGLTFLCGLLPIVGNLISNSVIVGVALTSSAKAAIAALVFLVLLHKLEYFLNSKIIGYRIKNPMWLTLLALVVGERFMGIPGMILAPVVLDYVKVEMSRLPPPR
jgi:predicted PurR-regulated permease PerM